MTGIWALATLWLGLALVASLLSIWFQIATAIWCGRWRPIFSSSGRLAILRPEVGLTASFNSRQDSVRRGPAVPQAVPSVFTLIECDAHDGNQHIDTIIRPCFHWVTRISRSFLLASPSPDD